MFYEYLGDLVRDERDVQELVDGLGEILGEVASIEANGSRTIPKAQLKFSDVDAIAKVKHGVNNPVETIRALLEKSGLETRVPRKLPNKITVIHPEWEKIDLMVVGGELEDMSVEDYKSGVTGVVRSKLASMGVMPSTLKVHPSVLKTEGTSWCPEGRKFMKDFYSKLSVGDLLAVNVLRMYFSGVLAKVDHFFIVMMVAGAINCVGDAGETIQRECKVIATAFRFALNLCYGFTDNLHEYVKSPWDFRKKFQVPLHLLTEYQMSTVMENFLTGANYFEYMGIVEYKPMRGGPGKYVPLAEMFAKFYFVLPFLHYYFWGSFSTLDIYDPLKSFVYDQSQPMSLKQVAEQIIIWFHAIAFKETIPGVSQKNKFVQVIVNRLHDAMLIADGVLTTAVRDFDTEEKNEWSLSVLSEYSDILDTYPPE